MSNDPSESRAHLIVVVSIVAPCVTTVFIAARIWTRAFILKSLGWDDYISLITLSFTIAYSIVLIYATQYGMGSHIWNMDEMLASSYYKWVAIQSTIYVFCLLGYKLVVLFLYLRLFSIDGRVRYATYAVMFWVVGYLLCNFITQVAGCKPISKFWSPATPGFCYNFIKADLVFGSMNWISDLVIFALPWPVVWKMQLTRREKVGVSLVFMSGAVACIVAVIRYAYMYTDLASYDRTWIAGLTFTWSVLELNTGLICSSAAVLKPFFNHFFVKTPDERGIIKYYFERQPSTSSNTTTTSHTTVLSTPDLTRVHFSPDINVKAGPGTYLEKTASVVHECTVNLRPGHKREDSATAIAGDLQGGPNADDAIAADYSQDAQC
ncbi:hypothetical protein MMC27_007871 [Xylographa pallens]|nr:hypothetical protein [Xylographa pallens]